MDKDTIKSTVNIAGKDFKAVLNKHLGKINQAKAKVQVAENNAKAAASAMREGANHLIAMGNDMHKAVDSFVEELKK